MPLLATALKAVGIGAALSSAYLGLLYVAQDKLIYMPRRYTDYGMSHHYQNERKRYGVEPLQFSTRDGAQTAHLVLGGGEGPGPGSGTSVAPPELACGGGGTEKGQEPCRVWLFMGGKVSCTSLAPLHPPTAV